MVRKKLFALASFLFALLFVAISAMAQPTGKIRGKVTDSQTGEALPLVNIIIEGTSRGAASDASGEYIILNVPPGTYSLRVSLLGYQTITMRNIRVSADLTTSADIRMPSEAIAVQTVEVVAEAPLINKSATNTVATVSGEELRQMPIRGVGQVFALSAGVVQQGGNFYVRGGRAEETAFYVDGVLANNPINGQLTLNIVNNAIEEVQSQIGGMTAEYGNAMSGVVNTSSRTGGSTYNMSFEVISDEILGGKDSKNFLGSYSYGQSEYVMTLGGPLIPGEKTVRFFVAGQRVFNRSGVSWQDGINFPVVFDTTAIAGVSWADTDNHPTPGLGGLTRRQYITNVLNSTDILGGRNVGGINRDSWGMSGNVIFDLGLLNVKMGGTYNFNKTADNYGRNFGIVNVVSGQTRGIRYEDLDMSGYARLTHVLSPRSLYTINLNYYKYFQESGDPIWFNNFEKYGDNTLPENAVLYLPSTNPPSFSVYSFTQAWPGAITSTYSKLLRSNYGGRFDFTNQLTNEWELKVGVEAIFYTIRTYTVTARSLYKLRQDNPTESDWFIYNAANVSFTGYDLYGNEFEGGSFTDKTGFNVDLPNEGPRNPIFAGAYVQNKFEFDDLIMNLGVRFDFFDPGTRKYKDLRNIQVDDIGGVFVVADESYEDTKPYTSISPRLGFSFPVTDQTVFHATYGKFQQMGRLGDLYDPRVVAARFFQGGFARSFPTPNLRPERTTSYEVGFRQQIGDFASFDLTFYYKDIQDLHVIRVIFPDATSSTKAWFARVNGDYGTSKGFSLNLGMRRVERVMVNATYTLSSATATGSSSATHFNIAWQDNSYNNEPYFPVIPAPTDFDRTHIGNVNVDYRFEKDDGPELFGMKPFERLGVNALLSFSSGVRFTRSIITGAFAFSAQNAPQALEGLNNSEGPWIYQLDLKVDRSFDLFGMADLNVYLWVVNVLNRKNVVGVYSGSGLPDNDGWFQTNQGQTWARNNGQGAVDLYNYLQNNLASFQTPRHVRLGIQLAL